METRKDTLSTLKVCRFCLTTQETLIPLYDSKVRAPKNSVPFALKILACIAIEIFPSDNMPQYICQRCKLFMELSYAFKQLCRQADEAILQFVQNGTPLTAMPWPSQLTKVYRATNKSAEANVVKTVVQGGAVKVMAEEVSDSDEGDDDNVYKVKIGDGSEEGKSIKVITSIDHEDQSGSKRNRQGSSKNSDDPDSSEVSLVQSGCWACDQCDCTYPLEQLLTLHKAQKHRERNETCNECGGKFFTKYDLEMHQLTHSTEMPFQCVACKKKFKRLILLKRHEKIMHSELPQQSCPYCPATFLSVEELEAHQLRHDRHAIRPYNCSICNKRFSSKSIMQKHTLVHSKKPDFSCQYCPEQFPSVSKLTRHVREHASARPFPCKHCDKSFTKSHHYTRHLRVKHSESIRTAGPYNESEVYRCEECEDTFATQDELMYHSALHATRNLTCPLCQEKFDDVDTVTAHIKSHVNGTEFMCDYCELIFTTKEKLETHMERSHDDELANDQEIENDESSMDMEVEDVEDDDDNSIKVKEIDGHMVVEIKKAGEYMLPAAQIDEEYKADNTQSEDSELNYMDSAATEVEAMPTPNLPKILVNKDLTITRIKDDAPKETPVVSKPAEAINIQVGSNPTNILRKADEIKRKIVAEQQQPPQTVAVADKKEKVVPKVESSSVGTGASDKSLRLLEKELQDLKRTNARTEAAKTPVRTVESLRNRRPQLFSSTPKMRNVEKKEPVVIKLAPLEKTVQIENKQPERKNTAPLEKNVPIEKKQPERKNTTKDTKEPKEVKSNNNIIKEDKEFKGNGKEEKEAVINKEEKKEVKEKEAHKMVVKNGGTEPSTPSTEDVVRRSTRPSKIKDYAKMIRDSSLNSDETDTDAEEEEEADYKEEAMSPETPRARGRRSSNKQTVKSSTSAVLSKTPAPTAGAAPRKRGRPRKEPQPEVPNKIKKDEPSEVEADAEPIKTVPTPRDSPPKGDKPKENEPDNIMDAPKTPEAKKLLSDPRPGVIISPSGQTLKKVPIKALPPGVKPLPLPVNSRLGGGEVTEMQIGKKIVKVQKIVMTKAEVEAMTKKGLLEIKDGTMVLKQGIKLPAADPIALKSTLIGDGERKKESPLKYDKSAATPSRCDLDP